MLAIFDLDGTLIDSLPDIHAVANAVLAADGLSPVTLEQVRGFIGKGVPHLVKRLLETFAIDPTPDRQNRMIAAFEARYIDAVTLTKPYPGVESALNDLAAMGIVMGICTNKPVAPTHAILRHLGLAQYFNAMIGGDSLPTRKPDPAPVFAAIDALGGGSAVYIGDSETDAATAAAAGLPFLLFTEGYRKTPVEKLPHDALFSDFAALPGLIQHQKARQKARQKG